MSREPLPCPFCGGELTITKHSKEEMYRASHRCQVIGAVSIEWRDTKQEIVDLWNTRADGQAEESPEPESPHAA